ncbi:LysM peptidoglycan-binding domain-containing protein [Candidatus Shapirobacteria bacterium]|nr:LysM peptidoglycan-binding domain-containing protein [Candidatus Shapirobacteria bacterium]
MVEKTNSIFRSKDDIISMFFGLLVVGLVAYFLINFIEKRKGNINLPGVSNELELEIKDKDKISPKKSVDVARNDSLWKIAVREYGDGYKWTEIAKANNLKNPGLLEIGQKLILPEIESSQIKDELANEEGKGDSGSHEYRVVTGDNLWKIAVAEYGDGYKWTKIWQDNRSKLNSPDKLEIGMMLIIYDKI